jgi:hypothetical protein
MTIGAVGVPHGESAKDIRKQAARIAGLLYLIVVITGIFSLAYVPEQINMQGDASTTVSNIIASESLFRFGIVASFICYTVFLLLPLALYNLLSAVSRNAAVFMVMFAVVSVPISLISVRSKLDIVSLLGGSDYSRAIEPALMHAQVMAALDKYRNGLLVASIFWGLWLLPFGYLVFKSGFLPRILGILLMIGCFGYLIDVAGSVMFRGYAATPLANFATLPASVGEIGTCLWLLIIGAREPKPARTRSDQV